MIVDLLLALGLLLSPATQLRFAGLPLGPGELLISLWAGLTFLRLLPQLGRLRLTPAAQTLGIFWLLFAASLCLGTIMSFVLGIQPEMTHVSHDVLAYFFVASISLLCAFNPFASVHMERVAWCVLSLGTILLALQLAHGFEVIKIPQIDAWVVETRFNGFSDNPNQMAFVCAILLFFALHIAELATKTSQRVLATLAAVLPLVAGILSGSDAFSVVLVLAVPGILVLKAWQSFRTPGPRLGIGKATSVLAVVLVPLVLLVMVPSLKIASSALESLADGFVASNERAVKRDAPERFELWRSGIQIGVNSAFLGLGPGPHVVRKVPTVVSESATKLGIKHFSSDVKPAYEVHNTLIDLFTQGGALAVAVFVWLAGKTIIQALRARLGVLAVLLCSLLVFSMFHFMLRHPMPWFVITWCLIMAPNYARTTTPAYQYNSRGIDTRATVDRFS